METEIKLEEETCNFDMVTIGSFFVYRHSSGRDEVCMKMHTFMYNNAEANAVACESGEGYLFGCDYKVRPVKEARFKC